MRYVTLTKGQVAVVDDADFDWLSRWKWTAKWHARREVWRAIRMTTVNGRDREVIMSRAIMDAPTGLMVDHINGDSLDNQRHNLRLATNQQNQHNQTNLRIDNTTGYKGVWLNQKTGNYSAQIYFNKRRISLGTRRTPEAAAVLYNDAALVYFGEFAALNRIEE